MTRPEVLTCAAHIWEGVLSVESKRPEVFSTWGQGGIELCQAVTRYADLAMHLMPKFIEVFGEDFPGVFDYEVSTEFGVWYAREILRTDKAPTRSEAAWKMTSMMLDWFLEPQVVVHSLIYGDEHWEPMFEFEMWNWSGILEEAK